MPKNHRVCGRSRCSDICKVRKWRPGDGVLYTDHLKAPKMQWPVYRMFKMESFGVEPVRKEFEEELCFEARKAQWFEARSRWIKVEESRLHTNFPPFKRLTNLGPETCHFQPCIGPCTSQ